MPAGTQRGRGAAMSEPPAPEGGEEARGSAAEARGARARAPHAPPPPPPPGGAPSDEGRSTDGEAETEDHSVAASPAKRKRKRKSAKSKDPAAPTHPPSAPAAPAATCHQRLAPALRWHPPNGCLPHDSCFFYVCIQAPSFFFWQTSGRSTRCGYDRVQAASLLFLGRQPGPRPR